MLVCVNQNVFRKKVIWRGLPVAVPKKLGTENDDIRYTVTVPANLNNHFNGNLFVLILDLSQNKAP